jgi:hypothetical protein
LLSGKEGSPNGFKKEEGTPEGVPSSYQVNMAVDNSPLEVK